MSDTEKRVTAKLILDDSGYNSKLKGVNAELKNNQAALKATQSGLEAFGKTTENVSRVQENLQRQMELQTKKVELYKSSINKANSTLEKSISERSKLKIAIEQEQAKLDSLKRSYSENNDAVRNSEKKLQDLQEQYDKTDRSIENNAKRIQNYETNLNKAQDQVNKTKSSIDKFNKSLENVDGFKSTKKRLEETSEGFTKFGEKAEGLGNKLTFGVTIPLGAAATASFKLASDLNENVNKTDVVFKNNADTVESWSKTSLQSMGMCQSSALEMASKFGDMSVSMGLNAKQTVKYSEGLTQLAADMASFKNISIERADEALTGVYTGETEALKSLGIVMTQTNLQRFAESKGIHKKIQDMSQAEQVQLRYNYVMSVTKDAQGDFARTSDQAANAGRTFKESTKELGATIGTDLLPMFTPYLNEANEIIKSLAGMDQGTRDFIIKTGMLAMAVGPAISGVGKLSKGIGGIIKVGSKAGEVLGLFSTASKVAEAATAAEGVAMTGTAAAAGTATVATGGLAASLLAVAAPALAIIAALGAVGFAAYKISKYFNSSATPAVDLFANKSVDATRKIKQGNKEVTAVVGRTTVKISEATKKAVGAYMNLDKKAVGSLMDLTIKSKKITKQNSKQLVSTYKQMGDKIKAGIDKHKKDELNSLKDMFSKTKVLTDKEQKEILKKTDSSYKNKKSIIDSYEKQINEILKKASNEHRQLTSKEASSINEIRKKMKEVAVKTLSENEVESKVILERIKDQDGHITAEQASTHIKELNKLRDNSVKAANEECDKRIAEIIRMRDESKVISKEQADKLIEEAKRQKKDTVQAAEDTRNQAVKKITSMSSQVKENVNTTTGELKSKWERFKNWWNNLWFAPKTMTVNEKHNMSDTVRGRQRWTGDSWYQGGFTTLHERGYELYDLPSGTRIYNHDSSEQLVLETAKQTAKGVIETMLKNSGGNDSDIIIPISIAGEEIDRIVVPRVSNKLALSTKRRR